MRVFGWNPFIGGGLLEKISGFKYRAFISYCHRDTPWARWLHNALERYRIDRDLVGRESPTGPVPKTLRPIFRDRDEFSAGHSLTEQSLTALDASQFLVVLCSPNAAHSKYVNEEVRYFKAKGGGPRVIPIIVEGEPGTAGSDCFPPALRLKVGPDGLLTDEPEEPLAADARPQGDGKEVAKNKVIAGLLGLGLDEVMRRAERARKRRARFFGALAGVFLLLAVAATGSAVYAYGKLIESNDRLDEAIEIAYGIVTKATAMSDRYGVPQELTLELLSGAESAINGLFAKGANTAKLKHRKAMMLLSFADSYRLLGRSDDGLQRVSEARGILADLTDRNPNNAEWQADLAISDYKAGDIQFYRGHLIEALDKFRASLRALIEYPGHDLSGQYSYYLLWSYDKIAMAELFVGGVSDALANMQIAHALAERVAAANPNDIIAQRDLALSHMLICDGLRMRGAYTQGLDHCRTAVSMLGSIVAKNGDNSRWQRDLAWSEISLGAILVKLGSLDEAIRAFQSAVSIDKRLVFTDPKNILWQWHLWLANFQLAQALLSLHRPDDARVMCEASRAGAEPAAMRDSSNYLFRRLLASSHICIGDVLKAKFNADGALEGYRSGVGLLESIASVEIKSAIRKNDLAWAYNKTGDALVALGRREEAIANFRKATALAEQITNDDGDNADWEWVLLWSEWRLSEQGEESGARLRDLIVRIRKLQSENRASADLARLLPIAEARLAKLSSD